MGSKPEKRYFAAVSVLFWTVRFCPAGLPCWETCQAGNRAALTFKVNACGVAELRTKQGS